jgi:uncharacterized protein YndB with AHSA1/START domain
MSTVHVTIEINAPRQRVWDTVMDPMRLKDWVTIHRSMERAPSPPLRQGAEMEQVLQMRGIPFHVHWRLVDVQPPSVAEWDGQGPAYSRARIRYQLSGDENGPVRFEYTNEFTPPGGRLGTLASRVVVGAASEREANNSLQRLKALLEGS